MQTLWNGIEPTIVPFKVTVIDSCDDLNRLCCVKFILVLLLIYLTFGQSFVS